MSDFKLAKLAPEKQRKIEELENNIGLNLVAYCVEENTYAYLNEKNLKLIKDLENELGIIILAYPRQKAA